MAQVEATSTCSAYTTTNRYVTTDLATPKSSSYSPPCMYVCTCVCALLPCPLSLALPPLVPDLLSTIYAKRVCHSSVIGHSDPPSTNSMQLKRQYNAHFIIVYKHMHAYVHTYVYKHVVGINVRTYITYICSVFMELPSCVCVCTRVCQHTRQTGCEGTLALLQ